MVSERDIRREKESKEAWFSWLMQRVETIHNKVTAHDVLRNGGVELGSTDGEEQFQCPFHGQDNKPSARVYPSNGEKRSHAWCFVCQERWDMLALWKKFNSAEEMSFSAVVTSIEKEYGITPPEMPQEATYRGPREDPALDRFNALYKACENRLRSSREAYYKLKDLNGFLSAGSVLDRLHYRVSKGKMPATQGERVLKDLIGRIGAKVRSVPTEDLPNG
jgi:hypothetical protein